MKLGIVISTDEAETAWNALRLANFSRAKNDEVRVFLVGKAVEYETSSSEKFDVVGEAKKLIQAGGKIMACGTCLKIRGKGGSNICPISSLKDLYELVQESEKVVSF
ncbi:MAG TPA: DsrE family protein [Candidatus Norongarragalinales archaeon]|nr:DsrE family protein [Candidatus Norongarragalinales archaeon]